MRILQVGTHDNQGGAARAAYRLHQGLLEIGQDSSMIAAKKFSTAETVHPVNLDAGSENQISSQLWTIQTHCINANRTSISNTLFSLPYPGFDLTGLPLVADSDVINLHWIAYFQSPATLKRLLNLGKSIVWTLHDMWAFTGGCHYSAGCDLYQQECAICPQLNHDPQHLAAAILHDRLEFFANAKLTIVTPSEWLADCARKSSLFRHQRIEVIPYSLETDVFVPLSKSAAKQQLGLHPKTIAILAGADNGNEQRKGFSYLLEALQFCLQDTRVQQLIVEDKFKLLCFGVPNPHLSALEIPVLSLGTITSDEKLSQVYSAADVFVLPSLEDNLPNTMLEAISCGTPVIGFHIGGVPDIVTNKTGRTVSVNAAQLAEAILSSIFQPDLLLEMSHACRHMMETHHALPIQANRYLELYRDLCSSCVKSDSIADRLASKPVAVTSDMSILADSTLGSRLNTILPHLSLQAASVQLEEMRSYLQQTQDQLSQTQARNSELEHKLNYAQATLYECRIEIAAMKTSKFWRLRTVWFKLTNFLRGNTPLD